MARASAIGRMTHSGASDGRTDGPTDAVYRWKSAPAAATAAAVALIYVVREYIRQRAAAV